MRKTIITLVSIALPFVCALVVAEVFVRAKFDGGVEYTLEMWKYARQLKRIAKNPAIGHEHVPGGHARLMGVDVDINSKGLRDREIPYEKPEGVTRVLVLGDSLTFGWGVPQDETTPKQLERALNARADGRRYEVINTGVGNYNTAMEIAFFFDEGKKYDPDMVILAYFINDAEATPRYQGNFINEHLQSWVYLSGRLDLLLRGSGGHKDWKSYYADLYRDDAPGWQGTKDALGRLAEWCRETGRPCVLANQPELHDLKRYPFAAINAKVADAGARVGLPVVDLLTSVQGLDEPTLWVTVPDPHPNARACGAFAEALVPVVVDALAKEPPATPGLTATPDGAPPADEAPRAL